MLVLSCNDSSGKHVTDTLQRRRGYWRNRIQSNKNIAFIKYIPSNTILESPRSMYFQHCTPTLKGNLPILSESGVTESH